VRGRLDVTRLGCGKAVLNCAWVALLLLGLAATAVAVDHRLGRAPSVPPRPPTAAGPPAATGVAG
jgi:hypothetical protein